jgi:hypothetical protein
MLQQAYCSIFRELNNPAEDYLLIANEWRKGDESRFRFKPPSSG